MKYIYILIILFISCNSKNDSALLSKITPPLKGIATKELSIEIDPSIAQVVRFTDGTSVEVPENAFIDTFGNSITTSVTLTIKPINSAAEIIASGIPMVYKGEEGEKDFESAGMFQIEGFTDNKKVHIAKGKDLTINYPSKVYGDFDFFYFDKTSADSIDTGYWKKISKTEKEEIKKDTVYDEYQLNFDVENYPELSMLPSIAWKTASEFNKPKDEQNNWVLNEKWLSLDISKPKYGFGDELINTDINFENRLNDDDLIISKDESRIVITKFPSTKVWSNDGLLLNTIEDVTDGYNPFGFKEDNYLIVNKNKVDYLYSLDGNLICKLGNSFKYDLISSEDRIFYDKEGSVVILNFKGKLIKKLKLKEDDHKWGQGIYEHFIVTPQNELITNSADGIIFYDFNGNIVNQRQNTFRDIEYLKENTLLLRNHDGTFTVWNYKTNMEIKSVITDFDLRKKEIKNVWHSSYPENLPEVPYVLINEAGADKTKLWDYKTNTTTMLDFHSEYSRYYELDSTLTNLIVGYNSNKNTYHLFDVLSKKELIKIEGFNDGLFNDGVSYNPIISQNKKYLIINSHDHVRLYNLKGKLIKDFKEYDALIYMAGFITNELLFTVSEDGMYRTWSINGKELSSKVLKNSEFTYGRLKDDKIITYDRIFKSLNYFSLKGDLLVCSGENYLRKFIDTNKVVYIDDKKQCILNKLFIKEPNVYQLLLRSETKEFITYVYLNKQDLSKINKYYSNRSVKIETEKDRQELEKKTIRRFKINSFGVYNWDRLIEQKNRVYFAAKFDFGIQTSYNDITVFHVTDINGKVVIKYNSDNLDKFSIDPKMSNKLLAILPNNKYAYLSNEDIKEINFKEVNDNKKFTFKMKIADMSITSLESLEKIIQ